MRVLLTVFLLITGTVAQFPAPTQFKLSGDGPPTLLRLDSTRAGLYSNIISDIRGQGDSLVWLGTGMGLSRVWLDSLVVETYLTSSELTDGSSSPFLPEGGVSALAINDDVISLAVAGQDQGVHTGFGLALTDSSREDWLYFQQPVETAADSLAEWMAGQKYFRAEPVVIPNKNVTYDMSLTDTHLWITSWSGGLRRYDLDSLTWERVPLPLDNQPTLNTCVDSLYDSNNVLKDFYLNPIDPPFGNHNHKGFAVMAYNDTVWVGTANGINRGIVDQVNGCIDWEHYFFPVDGISGNWVVGFARQDWNGQRIIWAVTINVDSEEKRGLSYTADDGATWHSVLLGERAYNVAAFDSLVLAATDNGLWRSDDGRNWALYKPAYQQLPLVVNPVIETDEITTSTVYSVYRDVNGYSLWIGTGDGLARSDDINGLNWRIFRTEFEGDYAYPNPFNASASGDQFVRFNLGVERSFIVEMDIFNFAMQKVFQRVFDRRDGSRGAYKWDGRDDNGRPVANGTYFIRFKYDNGNHWLKLIVVK